MIQFGPHECPSCTAEFPRRVSPALPAEPSLTDVRGDAHPAENPKPAHGGPTLCRQAARPRTRARTRPQTRSTTGALWRGRCSASVTASWVNWGAAGWARSTGPKTSSSNSPSRSSFCPRRFRWTARRSRAFTARYGSRARFHTATFAASTTSASTRGFTSFRWSTSAAKNSPPCSNASVACPRTRPSSLRGRCARGSRRRTRRTCSTAISNPAT